MAAPLPSTNQVDEVVEHLSEIEYVPYESELQLPEIMRLMKADLSEPYSVYTYRYFIHNWPKLCLMVCTNTSDTEDTHNSTKNRRDVTISMLERSCANWTFIAITQGEVISRCWRWIRIIAREGLVCIM